MMDIYGFHFSLFVRTETQRDSKLVTFLSPVCSSKPPSLTHSDYSIITAEVHRRTITGIVVSKRCEIFFFYTANVTSRKPQPRSGLWDAKRVPPLSSHPLHSFMGVGVLVCLQKNGSPLSSSERYESANKYMKFICTYICNKKKRYIVCIYMYICTHAHIQYLYVHVPVPMWM